MVALWRTVFVSLISSAMSASAALAATAAESSINIISPQGCRDAIASSDTNHDHWINRYPEYVTYLDLLSSKVSLNNNRSDHHRSYTTTHIRGFHDLPQQLQDNYVDFAAVGKAAVHGTAFTTTTTGTTGHENTTTASGHTMIRQINITNALIVAGSGGDTLIAVARNENNGKSILDFCRRTHESIISLLQEEETAKGGTQQQQQQLPAGPFRKAPVEAIGGSPAPISSDSSRSSLVDDPRLLPTSFFMRGSHSTMLGEPTGQGNGDTTTVLYDGNHDDSVNTGYVDSLGGEESNGEATPLDTGVKFQGEKRMGTWEHRLTSGIGTEKSQRRRLPLAADNESEACKDFVAFSDSNRDGKLTRNEYTILVNLLRDDGKRTSNFAALPTSLQQTFDALSRGGQDILLETFLDDTDAFDRLLNVFQHEQQQQHAVSLEQLCRDTRQSIGVAAMAPLPFSTMNRPVISPLYGKSNRCTEKDKALFVGDGDGLLAASDFARLVDALGNKDSKTPFEELPEDVRLIFVRLALEETGRIGGSLPLSPPEILTTDGLRASFDDICQHARQIIDAMQASRPELPLFTNSGEKDSIQQFDIPDNSCQYTVNIDVQIQYLDDFFAACDSSEQEDGIVDVIAQAINDNAAAAGVALTLNYSPTTFWDDDQDINNLEPFRNRRLQFREPELTCSDRQVTEQCGEEEADFCRWGCLKAEPDNCASVSAESFSQLETSVSEALRSAATEGGIGCLGIPEELQVNIRAEGPPNAVPITTFPQETVQPTTSNETSTVTPTAANTTAPQGTLQPASPTPANTTVPQGTMQPTTTNETTTATPTAANTTVPQETAQPTDTNETATVAPTSANATVPQETPQPTAQNATLSPTATLPDRNTSSPTSLSATVAPTQPVVTSQPTVRQTTPPTPAPVIVQTPEPTLQPTTPRPTIAANATREVVTAYNSWIMSNSIGLTSDDMISTLPGYGEIQRAYDDFTTTIVAEMEASRPGGSMLRRRRLQVTLQSGSSDVYQFMDAVCPTSSAENDKCLTAFGRVDLLVVDEDADAVYNEYIDTSQLAINAGLLQESLNEVAPGSLWAIEESSEPVTPSIDVTPPPVEEQDVRGGADLNLGLLASGAVAIVLVIMICLLVILPQMRKNRDIEIHKKEALEALREAEARERADAEKLAQSVEIPEEKPAERRKPPKTVHDEANNPYRERVAELINQNCPDLIDELDSLLHQFQGREEDLIAILEDFKTESLLDEDSEVDINWDSASLASSVSESISLPEEMPAEVEISANKVGDEPIEATKEEEKVDESEAKSVVEEPVIEEPVIEEESRALEPPQVVEQLEPPGEIREPLPEPEIEPTPEPKPAPEPEPVPEPDPTPVVVEIPKKIVIEDDTCTTDENQTTDSDYLSTSSESSDGYQVHWIKRDGYWMKKKVWASELGEDDTEYYSSDEDETETEAQQELRWVKDNANNQWGKEPNDRDMMNHQRNMLDDDDDSISYISSDSDDDDEGESAKWVRTSGEWTQEMIQ